MSFDNFENEDDYTDLTDVRPGLINRARPLLHQEFLLSLLKMTPKERQSKAREIGVKRKEGAIDWIHRNKLTTVEILTLVLGNSDTSITYNQLMKWEREGLISWQGSETLNAPKVIQITSKALDFIEPIRFEHFGKRELNLQETKDQGVGLLVLHSLMIQNVLVEKLRQFPRAIFLTETEVLQSHKHLTRGKIHKLPDIVLIVKSKKQTHKKMGVLITGIEVERSGKDKQPQDLAIWAANQMIGKNGADKFEYYVKDEAMRNRFKRTFDHGYVPRYDDGKARMVERKDENGKKKMVHAEREIDGLCANYQLILLSKKEWAKPLLVRHKLIKKVRVPIEERRKASGLKKYNKLKEKIERMIPQIKASKDAYLALAFIKCYLKGVKTPLKPIKSISSQHLKLCIDVLALGTLEIPIDYEADLREIIMSVDFSR